MVGITAGACTRAHTHSLTRVFGARGGARAAPDRARRQTSLGSSVDAPPARPARAHTRRRRHSRAGLETVRERVKRSLAIRVEFRWSVASPTRLISERTVGGAPLVSGSPRRWALVAWAELHDPAASIQQFSLAFHAQHEPVFPRPLQDLYLLDHAVCMAASRALQWVLLDARPATSIAPVAVPGVDSERAQVHLRSLPQLLVPVGQPILSALPCSGATLCGVSSSTGHSPLAAPDTVHAIHE